MAILTSLVRTLVKRRGQITPRFLQPLHIKKFHNQLTPRQWAPIRNFCYTSTLPPEKDVGLVATNRKTGLTEIYKVGAPNMSPADEKLPIISPLAQYRRNPNAITVCSGSFVYFLGGGPPKDKTAEVYTFDTSNPNEGFEPSNDMNARRSAALSHAAVPVKNGGVFVFGGIDYNEYVRYHMDPEWAEYFDPITRNWYNIEGQINLQTRDLECYAITSAADQATVMVSVPPNNYLVDNFSLDYNLNYSARTCLDPHPKLPKVGVRGMFDQSPVKVGDTLYWLNLEKFTNCQGHFQLEAYNLNEQKLYSSAIKGTAKVNRSAKSLILLGGNDGVHGYCFFTTKYPTAVDSKTPTTTIIHCIKFIMPELNNSGDSNAQVVSSKSYLSHQLLDLESAFLL